jgi:hypothetical protein
MTKKTIFSFLLAGFLIFPLALKAADHCTGGAQCTGTDKFSCESVAGCAWVVDSGTITDTCPTCLPNPLGSINSPQVLIGRIINTVLGVIGSLALLMFIYGGLTWMTSSGSPEKVKKGRDIIVWSAIGLVIIFASYGLVKFLITSIK